MACSMGIRSLSLGEVGVACEEKEAGPVEGDTPTGREGVEEALAPLPREGGVFVCWANMWW